jgi:hypothetical protein
MNWQKITKTNHPEFDVPVLLGKRNELNSQKIEVVVGWLSSIDKEGFNFTTTTGSTDIFNAFGFPINKKNDFNAEVFCEIDLPSSELFY